MSDITFIGLGEAASAFISGWGPAMAHRITAYDIKQQDPGTRGEIEARARRLGIALAPSPAAAVGQADLVFCTVTADQAVAAARAGAGALPQGAHWCDLNSCAPSSKSQAAGIIDGAGGRYVDVAVMAPVHPGLNRVPCLIAGPHAEGVAARLAALPMSLRVVEGPVGAASSIKMLRSVMVKGLEALTAECALAAVAAGVERDVLASLDASHGGFDWNRQVAYNFERAMVHGARRAAEMEEVVKTLDDLGLPQDMSRATVLWQRRIAEADVAPAQITDARAMATLLLPRLRRR